MCHCFVSAIADGLRLLRHQGRDGRKIMFINVLRGKLMGDQVRQAYWSRVLIDVCTQRDFLDPGAILQVANRDTLIPRLEQIFAWADRVNQGVVSSMESHRPTEPAAGPLHCIDGTVGQLKPAFAYLAPWILIEADNSLALPLDLRDRYRQLVFRKRSRDVLGNPKADRFLTSLKADEFIILGVGIERAIRTLALGLLARHKTVTVIGDACGYWSAGDADLSLRQLAAKHIRIATADEITADVPIPVRVIRRIPRRLLLSQEAANPGERPRRRSRRGYTKA